MPSKELYKDGKDIEDIKTSDHTWRGYTATSVGYPIAVLFTEDGDEQIQVAVTLENGDEKISLEDADVLAILKDQGEKIKPGYTVEPRTLRSISLISDLPGNFTDAFGHFIVAVSISIEGDGIDQGHIQLTVYQYAIVAVTLRLCR